MLDCRICPTSPVVPGDSSAIVYLLIPIPSTHLRLGEESMGPDDRINSLNSRVQITDGGR